MAKIQCVVEIIMVQIGQSYCSGRGSLMLDFIRNTKSAPCSQSCHGMEAGAADIVHSAPGLGKEYLRLLFSDSFSVDGREGWMVVMV